MASCTRAAQGHSSCARRTRRDRAEPQASLAQAKGPAQRGQVHKGACRFWLSCRNTIFSCACGQGGPLHPEKAPGGRGWSSTPCQGQGSQLQGQPRRRDSGQAGQEQAEPWPKSQDMAEAFPYGREKGLLRTQGLRQQGRRVSFLSWARKTDFDVTFPRL